MKNIFGAVLLLGFVVTGFTLYADSPPCIELVADDLLTSTNPSAPNFYMSGVTEGTPTPFDDFVLAQFFSSAQGTFDLATGNNTNYATCDQCILVHENVDASSNPETVFFQDSGTVTVVEGNPTAATGAGTIVKATLVEVTIDTASYQSTPVPNGRCIYISALLFLPRDSETPDDVEQSDEDAELVDDTVVDETPDVSDDSEVSDEDTTVSDDAASHDDDSYEIQDKTTSDGCAITIL